MNFEDPVNVILMLALASLISVALVGFAMNEGKDNAFGRRLKRVMGQQVKDLRRETKRKVPTQNLTLRRREKDSDIDFLNLLTRLIPQPEKLRSRIAKTGLKLSLAEYLLFSIVLALLVFFVALLLANRSLFTSIIMSLSAGAGLPYALLGLIAEKRIKKFLDAFPEAIDTICRGLRSGLPVSESIAAVGREMQDPIGIEFRRIADGVRMGRSQEDAMWEVAGRVESPEFRFLIIAMAIQRETGGNLAETLGNLADLLRRRRQMHLKIKAISSEARASAMIIGSLPFVMFGLLLLINPDYALTLFRDPRGHTMVAFGLGMIGTGTFVMSRMTKFEI